MDPVYNGLDCERLSQSFNTLNSAALDKPIFKHKVSLPVPSSFKELQGLFLTPGQLCDQSLFKNLTMVWNK